MGHAAVRRGTRGVRAAERDGMPGALARHWPEYLMEIDHVVTKPGPAGPLVAFVAELVISFVLMLVILRAVSSERFEKLAGLFVSVLIAVYLTVETPLSGMSLNPARTFASAFAARHWTDLWLYFVAPMTAMLLAAELHLRLGDERSIRRCPTYPVEPTSP